MNEIMNEQNNGIDCQLIFFPLLSSKAIPNLETHYEIGRVGRPGIQLPF